MSLSPERNTCTQRAIDFRGLSKGQVPERDIGGKYDDRRVNPGTVKVTPLRTGLRASRVAATLDLIGLARGGPR
jgi:hypothetical protein